MEWRRRGEGTGWERGGVGGRGLETGERGDAMGPAVQLRAAHPFVPLRTKGQARGCPREKGPRGLGSPRSRPDPEQSRAQIPDLPRSCLRPRAGRVGGALGPGRVGAGDLEGRGRAAGPLLGPRPLEPGAAAAGGVSSRSGTGEC